MQHLFFVKCNGAKLPALTMSVLVCVTVQGTKGLYSQAGKESVGALQIRSTCFWLLAKLNVKRTSEHSFRTSQKLRQRQAIESTEQITPTTLLIRSTLTRYQNSCLSLKDAISPLVLVLQVSRLRSEVNQRPQAWKHCLADLHSIVVAFFHPYPQN